MKTYNEVKIAIVVGLIMLTLCAVILISNNSKNKESVNTNIKIFKNVNNTYYECPISTEDVIKINKEYKKILNLGDESKVGGKTINGTYGLTNGKDYIEMAFDNDEGYIWINDGSNTGNGNMYYYKSSMYDNIINLCSSVK